MRFANFKMNNTGQRNNLKTRLTGKQTIQMINTQTWNNNIAFHENHLFCRLRAGMTRTVAGRKPIDLLAGARPARRNTWDTCNRDSLRLLRSHLMRSEEESSSKRGGIDPASQLRSCRSCCLRLSMKRLVGLCTGKSFTGISSFSHESKYL